VSAASVAIDTRVDVATCTAVCFRRLNPDHETGEHVQHDYAADEQRMRRHEFGSAPQQADVPEHGEDGFHCGEAPTSGNCRTKIFTMAAARAFIENPNEEFMPKRNAFYAQSGGVTAVINASACGVIETARRHRNAIGKVYAGSNGIIGALREELIDTSKESARAIAGLRNTPSGAFGSCRHKLQSFEKDPREYQRLIEVFKAHDIGYFFYNGGGDSQDTANKVAQFSAKLGYPITCIGVPKTVDNDLPFTDTCPGFGSVAKYVAVSIREAALDVASMCETSTKVFIMEVMGRHAGWIAAAAGLAQEAPDGPPHLIVFPEIAFDAATFIRKVDETVRRAGLLRDRRFGRRASGRWNLPGGSWHEGRVRSCATRWRRANRCGAGSQ
jgi:hypothetical protein